MAAANFRNCFYVVKPYEGGYVDHPSDPGGATNLGITIGTLRAWRGTAVTKQDVRNLTIAEAMDIYKARYWDMVWGDKLPAGLDLALYDYAVNSGPKRAVQEIQRIVGVKAIDGAMGTDTLGAINSRSAGELIDALCDCRMNFLRRLPTFKTFGKGWTARVTGIRRKAKDMARAKNMPPRPIPDDPEVRPAPNTEQKANPADLPVTEGTDFWAKIGAGASAIGGSVGAFLTDWKVVLALGAVGVVAFVVYIMIQDRKKRGKEII